MIVRSTLAVIAWRNVWRNRKRSGVIVAAIALGLCGGLFAAGINNGMAVTMVDGAIDRSLGHIQIHTKTFADTRQVGDAIARGAALADSLRALAGATGVSARAIVDGMAASAAATTGVTIVGIDPARERTVTTVDRTLTAGGFLSGARGNVATVSVRLAEKLGLKLRGKLVLSFPGRGGDIVYAAFRVTGTFATESSIFDDATVFVRRSDLETLAGGGPLVHEIALRLAHPDSVASTTAALRAARPDLAVESWKDLAPDLKLTAETTNMSMLIFLGIILFALLFGITNTMLMSVLERVREFGVLMAVGMRRRRVFALVMLETIVLSIVGGAAGLVFGAALVGVLHATGIDLRAFAAGLSSYGIASVLHPTVEPAFYLELAAMVVLTAVCAAVYPGIKAVRLHPAAAIRTYT